MKAIKLKRGRDVSLKRMHPWIFSGAVQSVEGNPGPGETVDVISGDGKWLARASYSPKSQILGRVWTFDRDEEVGATFFARRIAEAADYRNLLDLAKDHSAYRLCYAESDGIPGLIVDRYENWLVVQFLSTGTERWRKEIIEVLREKFPGMDILDRSDADVRQKEGLEPRVETITGAMPDALVEITEGPARFLVDLTKGHKTGFYLDQRENRAMLLAHARGKEVLNCFSYTGGFGIYALHAGAKQVINIDTSAEALEIAAANYKANGFDHGEGSFETADVFASLRKYRDMAKQFDIIILDPPKFVASASQMGGGTRGYKDINLLALKLLRPGGMLYTFSCSGLVGPDLFHKILSDAATDARREVKIMHHMFQANDHPVSIHFPEGLYLKGLACNVF